MLEVIILSAIQGITEFIPISSSAHLVLVSQYFNFNNSSLTLDISLHLGSLLAIITYFRQDIYNFIRNKNLFLKILISSIPTMIVGYLLVYYSLIEYLRDYKYWSPVARVDNVFGDRNLVCSCPSMDEYKDEAA